MQGRASVAAVPVMVNLLSEAELRTELMLLPRLPVAVAERIVGARPFADASDFVTRVNEHAANTRQHVGPTWITRFDFAAAERRVVECSGVATCSASASKQCPARLLLGYCSPTARAC